MRLTKISWQLPALLIYTSVLFYFSASAYGAKPDTKTNPIIVATANKSTWHALLHLKDDKPRIKDPMFLLSAKKFSPEAELIETLHLLREEPAAGYCRFPARHHFLSQFFDLPDVEIDDDMIFGKCNGFSTYKRKVPFDQITLVYASEVLSSASSMMGHIFLKATGKNDNNNLVHHSVSFFTEYDTYNPFKLIYQGLIGGMNGFFIVRPYERDLLRYSQEQRNVFEYKLAFSNFESELIKRHIWELKDVEISYLFQSYNCATLTLYALSIGNPELKHAEKLFVSPADVVKAVNDKSLIENTGVTLSNRWNLTLLAQELGPQISEQVRLLLISPSKTHFFKQLPEQELALATEYLKRLLGSPSIIESVPQQTQTELLRFLSENEERSNVKKQMAINFSAYNNPIDSQQDSIATAGYLRQGDNNFIDLSFLPASHYFRARNKQFFAESQLKIGEMVVRLNPENGHSKINKLTLYEVSSLVPSSALQPELSGNFYLGYRREFNDELKEVGAVTLSAGLGKTVKIHQDIMVYGLLDVGTSVNLDDQSLFIAPKIGGIMNLVQNVKMSASHQFRSNRLLDQGLHTSQIELSWAGAKNYALSARFESSKTVVSRLNSISLKLDFHF